MTCFNGVQLTDWSIRKARQRFADNALSCIEEAESGDVYVMDIEAYRAWRMQQIEDALVDRIDHTFDFLQRAYYIQTGGSVPLLP